jgi:hypothetical protein
MVHTSATKEQPGEHEGWRCYEHDPMTASLKCAEDGCDVIHPNAVEREGYPDGNLCGWRCHAHRPPVPKVPTYAQLVEVLADLEHDRWSRWEQYRGGHNTHDNRVRWATQRETPYADLPEHSKESDRKEARLTLDKLISLNALCCSQPWQDEPAGKGGDYTFEVKAMGDDGSVNQTPVHGQDFELPTMCFSTGAGAFGGVHGSFIFRFGNDHDGSVQLNPDGTVEYGKDYKPSRIAKEFWSVFAFLVPLELSTLGRCARIAMAKGVNAMAGRDQALEMGSGELAARLHMVGRAFQEYAEVIQELPTEMPTEVSPHVLLDSVRQLIWEVKAIYVRKDEMQNGSCDHVPPWLVGAMDDVLGAYEKVHAKLRTMKV